MRGLAHTALSFGLLLTCASVQAQQSPASPADTDPVKIGWMLGSPPPPDKRIKLRDGSFRQFPKTRWSFPHMRELVPTARVSRGQGPVATLPRALGNDLDFATFTPLGRQDRLSWAQAFETVYGDAVLILHKGKIVYERYLGVTTPDTSHIAFSVTKSWLQMK